VTGNCIIVFRPFGIPDFGVYGVAVSTVISQALAVVVMFRILFVHMDSGLRFEIPRPFPFDILKKIAGIGVPGGGDSLAYNIAQIATTYFVTMMGASALTAMVYMQNVVSLVQVWGFAVGQAAQIMVGYYIGAGNTEQAYKVCYKSTWIAMACNTTVSIIFLILCRPIMSIFTDKPEIFAIAAMVLTVDLFLEPGRVFNQVVGTCLRGAGDVAWAVVVSISSLWGISVVLSYVLGVHFKLGLPGVYIAFAADEWVRGQMMHLRWRSRVWTTKRVVEPVKEQDAEYA
jgi:Na+-driven multidrug efflux pump